MEPGEEGAHKEMLYMPHDTSGADPVCRLPRETSISKDSISQKCCWATLTPSVPGMFSPLPKLPTSRSAPCPFCWPLAGSLGATGEEASSQKRPVPSPYPRVSSEALGAGLKTPWNSFSLQTKPMSLAPWPLRVTLFIIKMRFIRYTVPLTRRPGSLCSFL